MRENDNFSTGSSTQFLQKFFYFIFYAFGLGFHFNFLFKF